MTAPASPCPCARVPGSDQTRGSTPGWRPRGDLGVPKPGMWGDRTGVTPPQCLPLQRCPRQLRARGGRSALGTHPRHPLRPRHPSLPCQASICAVPGTAPSGTMSAASSFPAPGGAHAAARAEPGVQPPLGTCWGCWAPLLPQRGVWSARCLPWHPHRCPTDAREGPSEVFVAPPWLFCGLSKQHEWHWAAGVAPALPCQPGSHKYPGPGLAKAQERTERWRTAPKRR